MPQSVLNWLLRRGAVVQTEDKVLVLFIGVCERCQHIHRELTSLSAPDSRPIGGGNDLSVISIRVFTS